MRPVIALAPLLVLAAACGGGAPPKAAPSSDTALVTWFGKFCTASDTLLAMPAPLPNPGETTTEADRPPIQKFLSTADTTLTAAKRAFATVPAGPTKSANDLLRSYRSNIDSALAADGKYIAEADSFPATELQSVYIVAGVDIGLFDPPGYPAAGTGALDKYLAAHRDLGAAYHRAPACTH